MPIMFINHSPFVIVAPHLNTFGLFLAGFIGCDSYCRYWSSNPSYSHSTILKYYIHCLYETQLKSTMVDGFNSDTMQFLLRIVDEASLTLSTPLDMYVFGYTLVHAPIQWHLSVSTSFDKLVSSLADHRCQSTGIY